MSCIIRVKSMGRIVGKPEGGRGMASEKLTAMKAYRAREPGLLNDGRGLYLRIAAGGTKSWVVWDRGTPRDATPPPPPGIRVRTTAVRPS